MRRPREKTRSITAFVDKVELSFFSEDRFSSPKAPRNAPGGVPDCSREHPRTPSGTPHKPHQAEVAPEPVWPRFSPLPADTLGVHLASTPSPPVVAAWAGLGWVGKALEADFRGRGCIWTSSTERAGLGRLAGWLGLQKAAGSVPFIHSFVPQTKV